MPPLAPKQGKNSLGNSLRSSLSNKTKTGLQTNQQQNLPRGIARNQIHEEGWARAFDLLMKHHLIEVPENFHNDEVPFNDPAELDKIMTALEDENLKMIDRLTDTAQLIEKEEIREM